MKRFFALFMVSALLAFTGSAFAAAPVITATPATVSVAPGETATVQLNATAPNEGLLSEFTVTGADWATVAGSNGVGTITLAPGAAVTPGSYTLTVSITETWSEAVGHGSTTRTETGTATIAVTVTDLTPMSLTATASATSITVGQSATITLTATGGTGDITFSASPSAGVTISGTTATFTPTEAGSYTITFTATDAAGRTATADVTITVTEAAPEPLTFTATPSATTIEPNGTVTITLSATGGVGNVTFSSSSEGVTVNGNSATFTIATAGTYTLSFTATDSAGNTATQTVTITVREAEPTTPLSITLNASATTVMVTRSVTITLSSAGGVGDKTFSSSSTGVTVSGTTATFTPTEAGTATLTFTVRDAEGNTASENITITVAPLLTLAVAADSTTVIVNNAATITLTAAGGVGDKTFTASPSAGVVISGTTARFTPTATGSYTITFTATDTQGNTAEQSITIEAIAELAFTVTASATDTFLSRPVTITLSATGGVGDKTFSSSSAGVVISGNSATFTPTATGTFTLTFTATDADGRTATQSVTITVAADPIPEPDPEPEEPDEPEVVENEQTEETSEIETAELPEELVTEVSEEEAANMEKDPGDAITEDDSYTDAEKELAATTTADTEAGISEAKGKELPDVDPAPSESYSFAPRASDSKSMADVVGEHNAANGRGTSAPIMGFSLNAGSNVPPGGGTAKAPLPRQPRPLWGLILNALKNVTSGGSRSGGREVLSASDLVFAADDEAEVSNKDAVVFFDSNGRITTTIPTEKDEDGNDRIGGFVTMATFIEPGKDYDIVLSIPTEDIKENAPEISSQVTTATKEVVLPTFHSSATNYFSTFVSADLIAGTNYYRISEDAIASKYNAVHVGSDWARNAEELAMATTNHYTMLTRLAAINATAESSTHTYIVAVNFSSDKIPNLDTGDTGGFVFYPNGPANAPVAARVLKTVASGDGYAFVTLTPAEIVNGTNSGYLAFEVSAGATLAKPMLAAYTKVAEEPLPTDTFAFTISKRSVTVKQGETETATITPVNNVAAYPTYAAYEGTTALTWVTFNNNAVTFAPTTSTAARTYNAYILGTDTEGDGTTKTYSRDVTITVTSAGGGGGGGDTPTPGALSLTASSTALNLRVGQTESITLTVGNLQGTASYTISADTRAGVSLTNGTATTATAAFTPTARGTYPVVFTVTDSGRTSNSTASTTVTLTATTSAVTGSSGGGCSAGFSALALAVLAGFIAKRRK